MYESLILKELHLLTLVEITKEMHELGVTKDEEHIKHMAELNGALIELAKEEDDAMSNKEL